MSVRLGIRNWEKGGGILLGIVMIAGSSRA